MRWLVSAAALLLAWLVVQNAVVSATASNAPGLALAVSPGSPEALIRASGYAQRAPKPPTTQQSVMLMRAVRMDPLYPEPFLAAATQALAQGERGRARRLGEVARSRDARDLAVHLFLLQEYAKAGDYRQAVAEIAPFMSLAGESGPALGNALSVLAQTPKGQQVIAAALKSNPSWRGAFIRQAAGGAEGLAFQTLVAPPAGVSDYDKRQDRSAFLYRLLQAGDVERAYLAWVNFLPAAQAGHVEAIYDGSFAGLPGLPPFNWTLTSNEAATAERRSDSTLPGRTALEVSYFGNDAAVIATETLFVQHGNYQFVMTASADSAGSFAGVLRWQLSCVPSGRVIPLTTVDRFTGQPFQIRTSVTIPAGGCTAQQLTLTGQPGDVSTLIHAQFTGLKLIAR